MGNIMGLYPNCQMTSFFMKEITLVCDFLLFMRMTFCIISKKTKLHTQKKLIENMENPEMPPKTVAVPMQLIVRNTVRH